MQRDDNVSSANSAPDTIAESSTSSPVTALPGSTSLSLAPEDIRDERGSAPLTARHESVTALLAAETVRLPANANPVRRSGTPIRWSIVVPTACLAATLGFWWDTSRRIADLQTMQQRLTTDLADMRHLPIIDVTGAPTLGSDAALVTLIEFSDYECPFCIRHFTSTMPEIAKELIDRGQLRYVFRDFPIAAIHPGSPRAHEAARCANDQGRFWQMHGRLFSAPGTHTDEGLTGQASAAGLDVPRFRDCLASGRHAEEVKASVAQVTEYGASGTPVFFIGVRNRATNHVEVLRVISGAQPYASFKEAIEAVAARASS